MKKCIFCQIAKKEVPSEIIWEDKDYLAFLNIKPESEGHTLVIPRKHYRWVWDIENLGEYFEKVREVKKVLDEKYRPQFVEVKVYGIDVPHAHIHLIPHY